MQRCSHARHSRAPARGAYAGGGEVSKAELHNHELVRVTRCVLCIAPDACLCDLSRCEAAGQGQVAVLGFREHMDLPGFATLVNLLLRVSR